MTAATRTARTRRYPPASPSLVTSSRRSARTWARGWSVSRWEGPRGRWRGGRRRRRRPRRVGTHPPRRPPRSSSWTGRATCSRPRRWTTGSCTARYWRTGPRGIHSRAMRQRTPHRRVRVPPRLCRLRARGFSATLTATSRRPVASTVSSRTRGTWRRAGASGVSARGPWTTRRSLRGGGFARRRTRRA